MVMPWNCTTWSKRRPRKSSSANPKSATEFILNRVMDLVFKQEALAESCGLGLRINKSAAKGRMPLETIRVEAIKGNFNCMKWIDLTQFRGTCYCNDSLYLYLKNHLKWMCCLHARYDFNTAAAYALHAATFINSQWVTFMSWTTPIP